MEALGDVLRVEWAPTVSALTPLTADAAEWEDLSDRIEAGAVREGFANTFDLLAPATATLRLQNGMRSGQTRIFKAGSVFGSGTFYRYRQVRICGPHAPGDAPAWVLFHGYITGAKQSEQQAPIKSIVDLTLVDRFGLLMDGALTGDDESGVTLPVRDKFNDRRTVFDEDGNPGVKVYAWEAVAFILEHCGLDLDESFSYFAAETPVFLPYDIRGNGLQVAQDYLEAEGARLSVVPQVGSVHGQILYAHRWAQIEAAASSPTILFHGDPPDDTYIPIQRGGLEVTEPRDEFYTRAVYRDVISGRTMTGDNAIVTPPKTRSRTNLPIGDANWAQATATMVALIHSDQMTYPSSVGALVWPGGNAATLAAATDPVADGFHGATLTYTEVAGTEHVFGVLIEGRETRFDHNEWRATWHLSNLERWATYYGTDGVFTLDSSSLDGAEILGP